MQLRLQVNLIITVLMAFFAAVLIALQIDNTRRSVREEVLAANVVATQLLSRMQWVYLNTGLSGIADYLQQVGRIRANEVELRNDQNKLIYRSPQTEYNTGRDAPTWYTNIVSPPIPANEIPLPSGKLILFANASRAVLDGWDDLVQMLWLVLGGFVSGNALVYALMGRALRPLHQVVQGLRAVADGNYHIRLTGLTGHEGRQLGQTFNRMVQSVQDSIEARRQANDATLALTQNRELTQMIQSRIEQERAAIARELHDELGQQVTAIKSVGLAIARRAADTDPTIESSARLVMSCADHIYEGMHHLISRLRPMALDQFGLLDALRDLLGECRLQHPKTLINFTFPDSIQNLDIELATAVYRIIQEAVTNALRHAQAHRIDVQIALTTKGIRLDVADNGSGRVDAIQSEGHFGLAGMRERAQALGGDFELLQEELTGVRVRVFLPLQQKGMRCEN